MLSQAQADRSVITASQEDYGRGVGQSGQPDEASANARLWQIA